MENVIEGIQRQCNRVRDELLPAYESIGPAGKFGAAMLKLAVKNGEAAIASGDVVQMVAAYKELESCE
jgi:hypothetical protein